MQLRDGGFTLVELIVAIAVIVILAAVAIPGFTAVVERNRTAAILNQVRTDMALARNAAIMRRREVVVCPLAPGTGCSGDRDWRRGWLVFHDRDGNRQPDAEADILSVRQSPAPDHGQLRMPANRAFLRYQVDGRSAGTNLTLDICLRGQLTGRIVVSNTGRVRSARPGDGAPCTPG